MSTEFQANTTAADTTELSTLTPTVGANVISTISGADARIRGNRISRRSTGAPESNGITDETFASANYLVTWPVYLVALESGTGAYFRLWARHQSAGNGYAVQWFDGTLSLRSYTGGSPETLGTYSWSPTPGVSYALALELNEDALTVSIDGTDVIGPVPDSTYSSAGQVGFSLFGTEDPDTTGWRIGAFTVDTLGGGSSKPRRNRVVSLPYNRRRAKSLPASGRFFSGATLVIGAPVLPPDYYDPRTPTVTFPRAVSPTVTFPAAAAPKVILPGLS